MPHRASAASAQALSMLFGTDETESAAQRAADAEAVHAAAAAAASAGVNLDAIMLPEDVADARNEPPPQTQQQQQAVAGTLPAPKRKAREAQKQKAPAAAPAISKQRPKQARKIVVVESSGTEMFQELQRLVPMGGHAEAPGSEPLELKSYTRRLMKAMNASGAVRRYSDWKQSAQSGPQ